MYSKPSQQITTTDPTIHDPRQRRTILIGVCIALVAVIASVSALNVAQSLLALAFNASQSDVLWMINIYTITLAALLLPLGTAGDRWGRKSVLILGLAVFGVASAAAGLATTTRVMLAARLFCGVGAAMIMPVTLAVITILSLSVGIAGAVSFVMWELRQQAPLLDVRLFRKRGLASGSVSLLAIFGVPTGIFVVLYPYLQAVLGWSGLRSTIALMPMPVLMIACSSLAPQLAARIGVRPTMATGIFLGGAGVALMAMLVSVDGGYLSVLPGYIVMGLGMGLSMTPSTEAITSSLPREQQGVASALNDIAREFGSALGIALLGAVFTTGYSNAIKLAPGSDPGWRRRRRTQRDSQRQSHDRRALLFKSAVPVRAAVIRRGWQQAMWAGVIVMAIVLVYVLLRGPERTSSHSTE